jgi:RNA polymerase sigma factor (sigma-70 family)
VAAGCHYQGMDDAELVGRARAGDKAAFAALLAEHRATLLALCRRALGDPALAEDAAQEAALQAMLGLDRLERPERFGAWLCGIGLNVCRRWQRERARASWSLEAVLGGRAVGGPLPPEDDPEALAETAEQAAQVRRAVAGLPAGQRAAVVLFHLAGCTHREVAALLGIGVGAVKTRLHKGRAALRALLQDGREDGMAQAATGLVEMRVAEVRRARAEGDRWDVFVVVLEEVGGTRRLPIWVGPFEGTALALAIEGVEPPRPGSFRFASALLGAAGGRLEEVRVTRLAEGVFYAEAVVEGPGGPVVVDARPSDALNLAVVAGVPIRADAAVVDQARQTPTRIAPPLEDLAGNYPDDAAAIAAEIQEHWAEQHQRLSAPEPGA